jgi:hypothetical protein
MERVYEWLLLPCSYIWGFLPPTYTKIGLIDIRQLDLRMGFVSGIGGLELLKDGWDEDEWIGTVGRHSCI